jgi:hypothetical protein
MTRQRARSAPSPNRTADSVAALRRAAASGSSSAASGPAPFQWPPRGPVLPEPERAERPPSRGPVLPEPERAERPPSRGPVLPEPERAERPPSRGPVLPGRDSRGSDRRGATRTRAGRLPVHREEHSPGIAAVAVDGNLVLTAGRVIAYYHIPLRPWSFRPESERLAVVSAQAVRLAQLAGRRCHLRVTFRPFPTWRWAEALDNSVRSGQQPMPGPCPAHPMRSEDWCPTCVRGHAWLDWLEDQQTRISRWGIADRDVYLGVELVARGGMTRLLSRRWSSAAEAEMSALRARADEVTAAVAGAGLDARPVRPDQLQWLFARSCALHLPAPLPPEVDPSPVPYALPAAAPEVLDQQDMAVYTEGAEWSSVPFGRTVKITRSDGVTAHVAVLTVGTMNGPDLTDDSPWIQRTDLLPFPCEWSITFDVRRQGDTAREMGHRIDRIRAQHEHLTVEHGQPAPAAMDRQLETAMAIEDDMEGGTSPEKTRVRAWARIAVAGQTEEEALERARMVTELYTPGITIVHSADQYRLAREFIPGEPLANAAHRRDMEAWILTGGMPAASASVGHRHGFPIGVTTTMAARAVTLHPWYATERLNQSGLITITGTLGGGKSTLAGLLTYMAVRAGIPSFVLDPSGLMDRLCDIEEIRRWSLAVNLLESPPGTLCPYRLIADPVSGTPEEREHAARAAAVARRALVADILKMLLPPRVLDEATEFAISEAVRAAPATVSSSPQDVIDCLYRLDRHGLADRGPLLAGHLEGISEHPLARLFFPPSDFGTGQAISQGKLLTVMTLRGLVIPGEARLPEERTVEEQLSIPVLHLAAQLLRRLLLDRPRAARKLAVLDEAHALTRDAVGRGQVIEIARDSRKNNLVALVLSQKITDLIAAGVGNLVGAAFAFRTEGEEAGATLDLLGLPRGHGYEQHLAGLSSGALSGTGMTGECLMRDGQGGLEQVQVDLNASPSLRAALNSTPSGSGAAFDYTTGIAEVLR